MSFSEFFARHGFQAHEASFVTAGVDNLLILAALTEEEMQQFLNPGEVARMRFALNSFFASEASEALVHRQSVLQHVARGSDSTDPPDVQECFLPCAPAKRVLLDGKAASEEKADEDEDIKKETCERDDFLTEIPSMSDGASNMHQETTKFAFALHNVNTALLQTSRLAEEGLKCALLTSLSWHLNLPTPSLELALTIGSAVVHVDICMKRLKQVEDWLSKWRACLNTGRLEKDLSEELGRISLATLTCVAHAGNGGPSMIGACHGGFLLAQPDGWEIHTGSSEPSKAILQLITNDDNSVSIKGHFQTFWECTKDPSAAARVTFSKGNLTFGGFRWAPTYHAMTIRDIRIMSTTLQAPPPPAVRHSCKTKLSPFGSLVQTDKRDLKTMSPSRTPPDGATVAKRPMTLEVGSLRLPPLLQTSGQKVARAAGQPLHVVFVADASGSMSERDVACSATFQTPLTQPLQQLVAEFVGTVAKRISRLEAVRSVISEFIRSQQEGDEAQSDMYSLVEFSGNHTVCFSAKTALEAKSALQKLPVDLGSTTEYTEGLKGVLTAISRTKRSAQVRIVFLSDGSPCDTDAALQLFQTEFGPCGRCTYDLQFHTIGIGPDDQFAVLQQLAALGRGSFQLADYDLDELCKTFTSVSTTITQTRGAGSAKHRLKNLWFERPHMFVFSDYNGGFTELQCESRTCKFDGTSFTWHPNDVGKVQLRNSPWTQGGMHVVAAARLPTVKSAKFMVAKLPKSFFQDGGIGDSPDSAECYAKNVAATAWFAERFVSRLDKPKLYVADCRLLDIERRTKHWPSCFVVEPFLRGVFVKFNNNTGYVQRHHEASDVAQAFSHFSYHESQGQLLVVDVQGIYSEGSLTLSDPQVLSADCSFGAGDLGQEGMARFFASHRCNGLCRKLGLHAEQNHQFCLPAGQDVHASVEIAGDPSASNCAPSPMEELKANDICKLPDKCPAHMLQDSDFVRNGVLELKELRCLLQELDSDAWDTDKVDALFQFLDKESKGHVVLEDFNAWLNQGDAMQEQG